MTASDKLREIAGQLKMTVPHRKQAAELETISYQLDEAAEVLGALSFPEADETSNKQEAEAIWLESMDILLQVESSLGHPYRNKHKKTGHKDIYKGHAIKPSKKRLELLKQIKEEHNER